MQIGTWIFASNVLFSMIMLDILTKLWFKYGRGITCTLVLYRYYFYSSTDMEILAALGH